MRLTGSQIVAGLLILLSTLIAFLLNIATNNLPSWIQHYTLLTWGLLIPSIVLFAYITAKTSDPDITILQIDEERLNYFIQVVSDAEQKAAIDSELEFLENWVEKLAVWKNVDKTMMSIIKVERKKDWKPHKSAEQLARLILRLTRVITPTMLHSGQWRDFIDLAHPAYTIGVAFKEWTYSAEMAYELAQTNYEHGFYIEAKMWVENLGKLLEAIKTQPISDGLRSKYLDMKGLLLRDTENNLSEARKCFTEALVFSRRIRNPLIIWRVMTHLGTLEKRDSHLDQAAELYSKALEGASQLRDSVPKLECYQALGDLAISQGHFDKAYEWYMKQLTEAESWRIIQKGRAHRGLAESLVDRPQPIIEQAYRHAREALRIEQETTGVKEEEIRILLIYIADKLYDKYCSNLSKQ